MEDAAAAADAEAALRARLAAAHAHVDALTLQSQGGTSLRVFFGAPWLVTTAARRLTAPPLALPGASLCALPGAEALVFFGGDAARAQRGEAAAADDAGGEAQADDRFSGEDNSGCRFGEAYALSLETRTWARAPGGRHAGRAGHAAAALARGGAGSAAGAAGAAGAPGGVVAVLGGRAARPDAAPALCADLALLAAAGDGALRWVCAAADATGVAPPPARDGAAAAATPAGDRLFIFGGADASGALSADVACLDVGSMAWLAPPAARAAAAAGAAANARGRASSAGVSPTRRSSGLGSSLPRRGSGAELPLASDASQGSLAGDAGGEGGAPAGRLSTHGAAAAWQAPRPRCGAALACDDTGRTLWLFGGTIAGGTVLSDLYSYDTDTGVWAFRTPALGDAPPPRSAAAVACAGHYLLLAGGVGADGARPLRDAWALDTERLVWECLLEDDAGDDDDTAADGSASAERSALPRRAPGSSIAAWRGRTLCLLRAGASGRLDRLETTEFALPDDIDALISTRRAVGDGGGGAGTLRLWSLALRGSTWLDLAWKPPALNAERVAGYKLMMAPAGAAQVRTVYSGHGEAARVGGLRPGTEYICVVKATYDDGAHVWSDTQAFRTARPRAPQELPPAPPFCSLPSKLGRPSDPRPRTAPVDLSASLGGSRGGAQLGRSNTSPRRGGYAPALPPVEASMEDGEDEGGPSAAASAFLSDRMMAVLEGRLRGDSPERMDAAAAHAAAAAWDNGEDVEEAVVIEAQY